MDKNKLIGIILLSLMLVLYTHFFDRRPTTSATNTQPTQHMESRASTIPPLPHSLFVNCVQGTAQEVVLENDVIRVVLTSQGAKVKAVTLKQYNDYKGQPLQLLDEQSSKMEFQFVTQEGPVRTGDFFFQLSNRAHNIDQLGGQISFTLSTGANQYLRQTFSLPPTGYGLTQHWEFVGFEDAIDQNKIDFVWYDDIKRAEQDIQACRNKTTINYYLADKSFKNLKEQTDQPEEQTIQEPIQWIAVKQRFFTAAILAQEMPFQSGYCLLKPTEKPEELVKEALVRLSLPTVSGLQKGAFIFYFGPNTYYDLKNFAPGFSKNLPLGWPIVKWINQYLIIPIFGLIAKYVSNEGLAILVLVIFIKLLLLPLSYKSYMAMAEMKVIKPALDALKDKYGKDMQQMQLEQVRLYREMGINPLSGCIPVLLQMPILLAMFNFFPNAIELRQKAFLWAPDLSTYDALINLPFKIPFYGSHVSLFTLLMTASTLLYTWSSNQVNMPQGPMKTMSYLLPITFMFILNSFPAGLSFYYFVSNLITFGQQVLIKKFVDEEKLKAKLAQKKTNLHHKDRSFKQRFQDAIKGASNHKSRHK